MVTNKDTVSQAVNALKKIGRYDSLEAVGIVSILSQCGLLRTGLTEDYLEGVRRESKSLKDQGVKRDYLESSLAATVPLLLDHIDYLRGNVA